MYSFTLNPHDHAVSLKQRHPVKAVHDSQGHYSPLTWILQKHLPLLHVLNQESRWQLWISSRPMLDKHTLNKAGISTHKVQYLLQQDENALLFLLQKALKSRNFSYIAVCTNALEPKALASLKQLANQCGTHLFIVSENYAAKHHIMFNPTAPIYH